jgi:hypothetical protein
MSKLSYPAAGSPVADALQPAPGVASVRWILALALRLASVAMARAARRLQARRAAVQRDAADPAFEFYAEAGAPEGALYLDGRLVGYVEGVQRL